MKTKKYLYDAAILRPFAIVLLVLYHSFIPYIHGWKETPASFQDISAYWWIAKLSYSFMLELFVFMSGYVFYLTLKKNPTFKKVLINKFKRLYIPCLFFSILYILLLTDFTHVPILQSVYKIISGTGHLWFLAMLFWTIIFSFLLYKIVSQKYNRLVIAAVLSLLSFLPLPLQINNALYYSFFFILGILFNEEHLDEMKNKCIISICSFLGFFLIFIISTIEFKPSTLVVGHNDPIFNKLIVFMLITTSKIIYSSLGCATLFFFVNWLIKDVKIKVPSLLVGISPYCFGIYLYQQFILMILYFNTQIPSIVGPYLLPWAGFVIALLGSFILAYLSRMTSFGRHLM